MSSARTADLLAMGAAYTGKGPCSILNPLCCGANRPSSLFAAARSGLFSFLSQGTRSIQYQMRKSSSISIVITATCKTTTFETMRNQFGDVVHSIKMKYSDDSRSGRYHFKRTHTGSCKGVWNILRSKNRFRSNR